jgi:uncharacterized protein
VILDAHSHVHHSLADHIALLDEAGVDATVLFGTRAHPERATDLTSLREELDVLGAALGGQGAADAFAVAGRELDAALAAYPERFIGFGSVPLDGSAERIHADVAAIVARGLRGIGELTPPPDRAGLVEPVLQAAADHGRLPVVVHGSAPTTAGDLATLVELARRYPTVPLVISQLGGAHFPTAIDAAREVPNVYVDLSTAPVAFAVRLAIHEVPERTLFGSDAPYGDPVLARAAVERATGPGELRDRVLGGTLAELLGM